MRLIITILLICNPLFWFSQTPQINGILVNACSLSEGTDEQFTFTTGSSSLDINTISITFPSGGTFCNVGCGTQTLVNNTTFINSLNTTAGCSLFQYANPIPANSQVVVFTGLNPTYIPNFSNECPGTYYAIFCNNTNTGGRFANVTSPISTRTLSVNFNGFVDNVTYTASSANTGDDGDYVSFTDAGVASYHNSAICGLPLPIELLSFTGDHNNSTGYNEIKWSTASEINNDRFDLYSSTNGIDWELIGTMDGAGNSNTQQYYTHNHRPDSELTYYKLKQVDYDGEYKYSDIISVYKDNKIISVRYFDMIGKELPCEPTNGLFFKIIQYGNQIEYKTVFK